MSLTQSTLDPMGTSTILRDISWRAHWIGHPSDVSGVAESDLGQNELNHELTRFLFANEVWLDAIPPTVPARITADSRYILVVNGQEVGRGPVRSQPRRLRYDNYDLSQYLVSGSNTIRILVTHYGQPTSFWQPAAPNSSMGGYGVLAFEADLGRSWCVSDESWSTKKLIGMRAVPAHGFHGIPVEDVDAGTFSHSWLTDTPDDTWRTAAIARATHLGALARSQPPTDPYGPMFPRPIGHLDGAIIKPVSQSVTDNMPFQCDSNHPVLRNAEFSKLHDDPISVPVQPDSSFELLPGSARLVTLDFGRIVCGYVSFDLAAPLGTRVDLLYQERDADPAAAQRISSVTGARYTARGSNDRFEALEVNGLRFIRALITAESPATVSLRKIAVREHLYPTQGEAFFHSSDFELNSLYRAGRRTVTLNSHDAYTDCPTREQRAWVGDGVVHQMVDLTTSTDWSLAWWYLELAHSPRYDGMLPRSVVGDMEYAERTAIPDWALNWIHGVHNFYRYDGSKDKLREYLPTVERILRWFLPFRNADGVLEHVPEWNLVDWSAIFLTGTSSIITAMWARGLREFAEMSEYVGNMGSAMWATDLWAQARSGFEVFWDPERATYVDHVIDGKRQAPASQLAGATAIVSGMAPDERFGLVVDWIGDPRKLVVQSWIGSNGNYDDARIAEHLRGVQRITWDPQEQVVRAEPFGSYIVHDAFATAGRTDTIIREIRAWSQFLDDGFDTFGECWGWGTPAHGWSATPTRDIVQRILGVEPAEPGFSTASINPAYGLVQSFSGAVPTPHGLIHLTVGVGSTKINSPVPFTLTNRDGSITSHPAGTVES